MHATLHTIEERRAVLQVPSLSEPREATPSNPSLGSEQQRILQEIHAVLSGWYAHGAANISIDGIAPFNSADQCIAILERSRLEEIQHVHRMLTGGGD